MKQKIDYENKMTKAMQYLVKDILKDTQENGLVDQHHFYITFFTNSKNVELSDWLKEKYPEEITIVIQNWYKDLIVDDDFFSITLNFSNNLEMMKIPFSSLKSFADPYAEFFVSLKKDNNKKEKKLVKKDNIKKEKEETSDKEFSNKVIKLDKFRKE